MLEPLLSSFENAKAVFGFGCIMAGAGFVIAADGVSEFRKKGSHKLHSVGQTFIGAAVGGVAALAATEANLKIDLFVATGNVGTPVIDSRPAPQPPVIQ